MIKQEPLGEEFQKVLDDNMSDLYEEDVMTKQTIEISVPNWEEVEHITITPISTVTVYKEKKPPRLRVFQCVSEEPRTVKPGEWYEDDHELYFYDGSDPTEGKYKIFKEVTE